MNNEEYQDRGRGPPASWDWIYVATARARSPPQGAVVLGTFPQVPTPSCAAGNPEARLAASAPTWHSTAEVAARAVGGCRKKRAGGHRAQRPVAVEWRDRRGSHLKQGGSSNTSTRQGQDGCLSQDRERRRRRRERGPRDTAGPHQSSLSRESISELQSPVCSVPPNRKAAGTSGRAEFWSLQSPERSIVSVPPTCREPNKRAVCIFVWACTLSDVFH